MIVVDGYNLIGREAGSLSGLSLEREREGLIRRLEQMSAVTGERFLVVFDGGVPPEGGSPPLRKPAGKSPVAVAFSKPGESADTWIVKYFSRRPVKRARLVTGDRELARKVRTLGFRVGADLNRLETDTEPFLFQPLTPASPAGGLLGSLSRQSREALAQARKRAKKS